jgi:hypothetical protein
MWRGSEPRQGRGDGGRQLTHAFTRRKLRIEPRCAGSATLAMDAARDELRDVHAQEHCTALLAVVGARDGAPGLQLRH